MLNPKVPWGSQTCPGSSVWCVTFEVNGNYTFFYLRGKSEKMGR
jgi:hypothetical protein